MVVYAILDKVLDKVEKRGEMRQGDVDEVMRVMEGELRRMDVVILSNGEAEEGEVKERRRTERGSKGRDREKESEVRRDNVVILSKEELEEEKVEEGRGNKGGSKGRDSRESR